jgi:hypothetical protein
MLDSPSEKDCRSSNQQNPPKKSTVAFQGAGAKNGKQPPKNKGWKSGIYVVCVLNIVTVSKSVPY